jgi:glutamate dehydrogenase (NADP+)
LARVVTASDSSGTVVDEAGFTAEKLARLCEIKASRDGARDYAREFGLTYLEGKQPWSCRWISPCRAPRRTSWTSTPRAY